jgi:hypothetical protein
MINDNYNSRLITKKGARQSKMFFFASGGQGVKREAGKKREVGNKKAVAFCYWQTYNKIWQM